MLLIFTRIFDGYGSSDCFVLVIVTTVVIAMTIFFFNYLAQLK